MHMESHHVSHYFHSCFCPKLQENYGPFGFVHESTALITTTSDFNYFINE